MDIKKWLDKGLEKGLSDVEISSSKSASIKLVAYDGKIEQNTISDVSTLSVRGVYQGKIGKVRYEHISDALMDQVFDQLIENAKALTVVEPAIIYEGSKSYPEIKPLDFDFSSVPMTKKVEDVLKIEALVKAGDNVSQVQTTVYQEQASEAVLANTKGLSLSRKNRFAYAYTVGVFGEGDDKVTESEFAIFKTYDDFHPEKIANEAVTLGNKKLGAKSIPTKVYPVVFNPETFADLLSMFSSLFSEEAAYRNMTPFKDKVGQQIFHSSVSILDDPLHEKAYFQVPFDDEGVACQTKYLVKEGVFQGFVNDLKMATMMKKEPTGNSFYGGIQMTNMYLEPGELDFETLIKPIDEGVYITGLMGLHAGVKAISGDFSVQASGFLIEQGKVSKPVNMIVVSGNFFEALNHIKAIGNDLEFDVSGNGSPSVYFEGLSISGEEASS
jgi:PmbA protein